jgi:hypothetical protein
MKVQKFQPTLSLKPTQFSIGLLEVEFKVVEMKALKPKKLARLIKDTPVPVVISPSRELCIIDHHHFVFACWHADVKEVRVKVVKDLSHSKLRYREFWQMMAKKRYAYLNDQFGDGPRHALYLPIDIRGMADDPYRSLAWMVRKEGGFENSSVTFAEFRWADYFRQKRLLDSHGRKGFHAAIHKGIQLARSQKAAALPGYIGSKVDAGAPIEDALIKSRYVPTAQKKGALATKPIIG